MNTIQRAMSAAMGRRLPIIDGDLTIDGLRQPVRIRRDRFGIPHIDAGNDHDAWFALGFCQGQDRAFQLETLLRVVRGNVAALVGPDGLVIDRLSRRIGFHRVATATLAALEPDVAETLEAFAAGVTAGNRRGLPRRPHEYVLLRSRPSSWTSADVAAMVILQSFALAANWDVELARLEILLSDGESALRDLDPSYRDWYPVTSPPGTEAGPAIDVLAADVAAFRAFTGLGGASNNWALSGAKTRTGRPILANDPHLAPLLPSHWYLCHLVTPDWAVAGAAFAGAPGVPAGHNDTAAWGVTAGLIDNTDLFVEQVGPDGRTVLRGDRFVPCDVIEERIEVRGEAAVTERVLLTDRGPIVGPAFDGEVATVSLQATWLSGAPMRGLLGLHRVRSFDEFREQFRAWPALSLNMAYADTSGTIGWQLIGGAPRRRKGSGALPLPAWDPDVGWEDDGVPFDDLPHARDPQQGWLATANNKPVADGEGPYLGSDWLDGYRVARIGEALEERYDWDVEATLALQTDVLSLPWREMRDHALPAAAAALSPDLADAMAEWDGRLDHDSVAAALFQLFLAEMHQRLALARAPQAARRVLGEGFTPLVPHTLFAMRRSGLLARLLAEQPDGWFPGGWTHEMEEAFHLVERRLRVLHGDDPGSWMWGTVRPLTLRHALGDRAPLGAVFNRGPFPIGGDGDTVAQASPDPADPTSGTTVAIASLRMAIDVGDWERCRWVLPGGQSGNPFSPHYDDQLTLWREGDALPIQWSEAAVAGATHRTLTIHPPELPDA